MTSMLALPLYDLPTRSSSGFLLRWIAPRMGPVQLISILDTSGAFQALSVPSDIIVATGHGNPDILTGHKEAVILRVGDYDPKVVAGKVLKFLSCQTGNQLGPDTINNGALSYAGYGADYVWVVDADKWMTPWSDEFAAKSIMPVVDSINALLDGETAQTAFDIEMEGYTRNADLTENELIRSCLKYNRNNAVLLGDPEARVKPRPKITMPLPPPPIIVPVNL